MKMDRLLHMVILLLNRRRMKARELADTLGVTVRTVYRDMESLCQAGIPLVTYQGQNGGIGIAEGYRLDRTVMTDEEWASVMVALKSLSKSYTGSNAAALVEKLRTVMPEQRESFRVKTESVLIDFSPWGADARTEEKVRLLKEAVESGRMVAFAYTSAKNETLDRRVEPHTLVLKGQSWYLYGWCGSRQDFRLFKLSRMREIRVLQEGFARREVRLDQWDLAEEWNRSGTVEVLLRFEPGLRMVVEDRFGVEQVELDEAGRVLVRFAYREDEWLYGFLLSFGPGAEVLEPPHLREILRDRASRIAAMYDPIEKLPPQI